MQDFRQLVTLVESKASDTIEQVELPYKRKDLYPALSEAALDYHYGKLYKGYVDRYNSGEGDADFNEAGAFLHNIFFTQFRSPKNGNPPKGKILDIINLHHKDATTKIAEKWLKIRSSL